MRKWAPFLLVTFVVLELLLQVEAKSKSSIDKPDKMDKTDDMEPMDKKDKPSKKMATDDDEDEDEDDEDEDDKESMKDFFGDAERKKVGRRDCVSSNEKRECENECRYNTDCRRTHKRSRCNNDCLVSCRVVSDMNRKNRCLINLMTEIHNDREYDRRGRLPGDGKVDNGRDSKGRRGPSRDKDDRGSRGSVDRIRNQRSGGGGIF